MCTYSPHIAKPIRQPARRTPLSFQAKEANYLQKQLDAGVVVPSCSAWASPVVLVRKNDGGVRWCVDYRKVNEATQKDVHPLPKIEECLDTLSVSKLCSTLDLLSGYHQFEVKEKDRPKTAFFTKHGLFEFRALQCAFHISEGHGTSANRASVGYPCQLFRRCNHYRKNIQRAFE